MGKAPSHKMPRYGAKVSHRQTTCSKQFPECPETPNHNLCNACPLWGTGLSSTYKQKWVVENEKNI